MKSPIILIYFLLIITSCSTSDDKTISKVSQTKLDTSANLTRLQNRNSDTLTVDKEVVIIFQRDSLQIADEIKKLKGIKGDPPSAFTDVLMAGMHEEYEKINRFKIPILKRENEKFLKFQSDNTSKIIRFDTLQDICGMYFFVPGKKPLLVDINRIEKAYKIYFKQ